MGQLSIPLSLATQIDYLWVFCGQLKSCFGLKSQSSICTQYEKWLQYFRAIKQITNKTNTCILISDCRNIWVKVLKGTL